MNILWVENHPHFPRLTIPRFLKDHVVTVVPSLAAASQALAQACFDVILIDFDLDDGKGTEVVHIVESLPGRPWLVAASAHDAGNQALMEAGADAVCAKSHFDQIGQVLAGLGKRDDP